MADKTYDEWCKIVNDKFDEIEDPQWSDIRKVANELNIKNINGVLDYNGILNF